MPKTKPNADVWHASLADPAQYALWNPKQQFAYRLHRRMQLRDLSNSDDLARLLWGETTDLDGKTVAKNRDLIRLYLRGLRYPEPRTMERLATALEVEVQDLTHE